MDTDAILAAVKILGASIGGVLGVAGLIFDFKTPRGGLSRSGYAVFIGIVASALTGIGSSVLEEYKAKADTIEEARRTERLLHEIERSVQPITEFKMTCWVEVTPTTDIAKAYIDQVRDTVQQRISSFHVGDNGPRNDGLSAGLSEANGEPIEVLINKNSDLWPKDQLALLGKTAEELAIISTYMYKIPPNDSIDPFQQTADFEASNVSDDKSPDPMIKFWWNRETGRLFIYITGEITKTGWTSNGKIRSIVDLPGAQIRYVPPQLETMIGSDVEKAENSNIIKLIGSFELGMIALSLAEGQTMYIDGKHFIKQKNSLNYTEFVATFPSSEADFQAFTNATIP
jgi:hypothetical protein